MLVVSLLLISVIGPLPVIVLSTIYVDREHLEVVAGCIVVLCCLFILVAFALDAGVPT